MHIPRAVITSVVTFNVLIFGMFWYNNVFASTGCVVKQSNAPWTVNPDNQTITGTFIVTGGIGCQEDVSVISWNADTSKLPGDAFWTTQTVNDVQTQTLGAGTHSITVKIPACSGYQADVVAGDNPSSILKPPGQGSYYDGKQLDGSTIVVASAVSDNKCSSSTPTSTTNTNDNNTTTKKKEPKTTTTTTITPITTPTTTPLPTHTFTPATTVIPSPSSGTPIVLASAPKPTSLPNTGPGTTIGLFVLVSVAAGLVHHRYHHRKHRLAELTGVLYSPAIHHPQHHLHHHQDHSVSHAEQQHQQIHEHSQPLEHIQHENNQQNPHYHQ